MSAINVIVLGTWLVTALVIAAMQEQHRLGAGRMPINESIE